jgi:hypothetical protein
MRTSILLAAATATTLVLASVGPSAVAQGMGGQTMTSKKAPPKAAKAPARKAAKAAPRRTAAAPKKKTAAKGFLPGKTAKKGPGQCGTYMYWKGGKCVDARAPSK